MDELGGPQELTEDVALVNILQQSALADDGIQVSVWGRVWVSLGARAGLAGQARGRGRVGRSVPL